MIGSANSKLNKESAIGYVLLLKFIVELNLIKIRRKSNVWRDREQTMFNSKLNYTFLEEPQYLVKPFEATWYLLQLSDRQVTFPVLSLQI